jgi:hypothetical protein
MAHPIAERMLRQRWLIGGGSSRRPEGAARPEARRAEVGGRGGRWATAPCRGSEAGGPGGRWATAGKGRRLAEAPLNMGRGGRDSGAQVGWRRTTANPGMAIARGRGRGSNGDAQAWRRWVLNGAWQSLEVAGGRGAGGGVIRRSPARRLGLWASEVGAPQDGECEWGGGDAAR